MKIGILGHYGNRNLGDEAIIEAAIQSVRRHFPGSDICCFSVNPADTQTRHGVEAFPLDWSNVVDFPDARSPAIMRTADESHDHDSRNWSRTLFDAVKQSQISGGLYRFLRRTFIGLLDLRQELPFLVRNYKHLKEFDLILVTGSNQFLDNFGGVWGFPYTLLKWVSMAKMAGTNVALVSLGAGPLTSPFSKLFAKATVRLSDYVSYRDAPSRDLVEGPSNAHKSHVYPDLASNLELREAPEPIAVVEGKIIGINPMPMYDCRYWCDPDDRRYSEYVGKLASAVIALNKSGHHCFLYNTQEQDKLVIDDVIKRIDDITGTEDTARVERKESDTTTGLIHVIRSADISVTTRFHGAVLSLRCGVPVVGICYHRKIADLLDNMEQGEYKLDLDVFDAGLLVEKVNRLIANGQEQKELIQKNSERNRELVEKQYRLLARLFPAQSVNDQF